MSDRAIMIAWFVSWTWVMTGAIVLLNGAHELYEKGRPKLLDLTIGQILAYIITLPAVASGLFLVSMIKAVIWICEIQIFKFRRKVE